MFGLGEDTLRALAVLFLLAFGLLLIVPAAAARVEGALSGLARLGPRTPGDGSSSVRPRGRRRARLRLRALRGPDPRRGDLGERRDRCDGRPRGQLRGWRRRGAAGDRPRRPPAAAASARSVAAARHGRRDGGDGGCGVRGSRRPLPGGGHRQAARAGRQPCRRAGALGRRRAKAHEGARRAALRRDPLRAAGPRRGPRVRRCDTLVQLAAAVPARPARKGRADRLLDLHVHQLPADAALSAGVG